jgi:hypothetical protein
MIPTKQIFAVCCNLRVMSRDDAPHYAWVCHYCGATSPSSTVACTSCGFPAQTSAADLERAKQLGSIPAFVAERQDRRDKWRRKPLPKKALIVVAMPLAIGGVILLRFAPVAFAWKYAGAGAAAVGVALLLGRLSN